MAESPEEETFQRTFRRNSEIIENMKGKHFCNHCNGVKPIIQFFVARAFFVLQEKAEEYCQDSDESEIEDGLLECHNIKTSSSKNEVRVCDSSRFTTEMEGPKQIYGLCNGLEDRPEFMNDHRKFSIISGASAYDSSTYDEGLDFEKFSLIENGDESLDKNSNDYGLFGPEGKLKNTGTVEIEGPQDKENLNY